MTTKTKDKGEDKDRDKVSGSSSIEWKISDVDTLVALCGGENLNLWKMVKKKNNKINVFIAFVKFNKQHYLFIYWNKNKLCLYAIFMNTLTIGGIK